MMRILLLCDNHFLCTHFFKTTTNIQINQNSFIYDIEVELALVIIMIFVCSNYVEGPSCMIIQKLQMCNAASFENNTNWSKAPRSRDAYYECRNELNDSPPHTTDSPFFRPPIIFLLPIQQIH